MKKNTTKLVAVVAALMMGTSVSAQSYLCSGNNIKFEVETADLSAGDSIAWYYDAAGTMPVSAGSGVSFEASGGVINAVVKFTGSESSVYTTSSSAATEKTIYAMVTSGSAGLCAADEMEDFTVTVLPALTVSVTDITAAYCANDVQTGSITATVPTVASLPAGVSIDYNWTLNSTAVSTGVTSSGFTSTLDYTTSASAGIYTYEVNAQYNVGTGAWIGAACAGATADTDFTVSEAPATPTISAGTF